MTHVTLNEDSPAGFAFWLRFWCRVVAALQIAGGLCGIYILAFGSTSGGARIVFLAAFCLFAAAVWSGVLLALGGKGGVTASLVVQVFQLVQVNVPGVLYSFGCGLMLVFGFRQNDNGPFVGFIGYFPSRFFLFTNPPAGAMTQQALTGLNLVAVLCIVCLCLTRAAEKKHALDAETETAAALEPEGTWPPAPKP